MFYQNVDDELDWMKEKEQSLSLSDLSKATDYTMVFHKLHSHQALEAEVHNHEATLRNIIDNGNELSSKKDYAADTILSKIDELENTWDDLYDVIAKRKDRIEEMMEGFGGDPATYREKIEDIEREEREGGKRVESDMGWWQRYFSK